MSVGIVVQQMAVIFLLILSGFVLFRLKLVDDNASKALSNIVVNITNPAILILSAFDEGPKESLSDLGLALVVILVIYAFLIGFSYIWPRILKVPSEDDYAYKMITIFGNIGFLGIPLVSALVGARGLIYVSLACLVFNFLIYTYGLEVLRKEAEKNCERTGSQENNGKKRIEFKKLINPGTVSAVATVILYLCNIKAPEFITDTLSYAGNCTTYLSMLVLGIAIAQTTPKKLFFDGKMYIHILVRQILIPIVIALILKQFISNDLILSVLVIEFAVAAGNMPLMFSKQLGLECETISRGVILTTLFTIVTIPIVLLFI